MGAYYQLKDASGNIVYHGITERSVQVRLLEHARNGKTFSQVSYIDDLVTRVDARNFEGSALYNARGDANVQNAVRKDGGFYHSYDPDNLAAGRTYLTQAEIDKRMATGKSVEVDINGKIKCS